VASDHSQSIPIDCDFPVPPPLPTPISVPGQRMKKNKRNARHTEVSQDITSVIPHDIAGLEEVPGRTNLTPLELLALTQVAIAGIYKDNDERLVCGIDKNTGNNTSGEKETNCHVDRNLGQLFNTSFGSNSGPDFDRLNYAMNVYRQKHALEDSRKQEFRMREELCKMALANQQQAADMRIQQQMQQQFQSPLQQPTFGNIHPNVNRFTPGACMPSWMNLNNGWPPYQDHQVGLASSSGTLDDPPPPYPGYFLPDASMFNFGARPPMPFLPNNTPNEFSNCVQSRNPTPDYRSIHNLNTSLHSSTREQAENLIVYNQSIGENLSLSSTGAPPKASIEMTESLSSGCSSSNKLHFAAGRKKGASSRVVKTKHSKRTHDSYKFPNLSDLLKHQEHNNPHLNNSRRHIYTDSYSETGDVPSMLLQPVPNSYTTSGLNSYGGAFPPYPIQSAPQAKNGLHSNFIQMPFVGNDISYRLPNPPDVTSGLIGHSTLSAAVNLSTHTVPDCHVTASRSVRPSIESEKAQYVVSSSCILYPHESMSRKDQLCASVVNVDSANQSPKGKEIRKDKEIRPRTSNDCTVGDTSSLGTPVTLSGSVLGCEPVHNDRGELLKLLERNTNKDVSGAIVSRLSGEFDYSLVTYSSTDLNCAQIRRAILGKSVST